MGTKFEWPDISKNITVTGQLEADFEGNFSEADNRQRLQHPQQRFSDASGLRAHRLDRGAELGRLLRSWTRLDALRLQLDDEPVRDHLRSALTGATFTTRTPQMRLGLVQKLGGSRDWKLSPEFAIMMPSEGNLPGTRITCPAPPPGEETAVCTLANLGLSSQIGYGERQGADSAKA
jgi:hypothetical protein